MLAALDFAPHQACALQHQNVLRDGVQRYRERPGNFGDRGRPLCERGQDGAPRGVGDGCKDTVESFRAMFNHLVEY